MKYYLYHHGILGQRWGKRNGPPYPLDASDHSSSEKKAGWKKSLDKGSDKSYNSDKETDKKKWHLSDRQKRAIKIGATVAATALLAYGTYRLAKSGKLNELAEFGKNKVDELLGNKANAKEVLAGNADDILKGAEKAAESAKTTDVADKVKNVVASGFKKLARAETIDERLQNTNLLLGKSDGTNNCSTCAIAAFLRGQGYDVHSTNTNGQMQNIGGVIEKCFKGAKVLDGSAIKFGKSRKDAAEMLLKRYGDNAEGVVGVQWRNGRGGHIFNWIIRDGVVSFFDAQQKISDDRVSMRYWGLMDPQGALQLARLDGLEVNYDAIKEFVSM